VVEPRYLRQRRWFGTMEPPRGRVELSNPCLWEAERGRWSFAFVVAHTAEGRDHYFLPLGVDWEAEPTGPAAGAALARVRRRSRTGILYDALAEPRFCRDLIGALVARKTLMWPDASIEFVGTDALPALSSADVDAAPLRRLGAESSNSAFVLGDLFCKAYRRLREGVNPEWEMSRFLTERSRCDATVPALGAIELMRGGGDRYTLALVQAAVPIRATAGSTR